MKIDMTEEDSLDQFHDLIQRNLEFPPCYGRNLDAFWDCLTDITGEIHVELVGIGSLPPRLSSDVGGYVALMKEYSAATNGVFSVVTR